MPEFAARDHAQQVNIAGDNTGTVNITAHHHEAVPPLREPITAGLPAPPRAFLGRHRELQQILEAADSARGVSICAIDGMAGVGKTALAVRAAHELASRFPDGQYFVELHAHTPEQKPADPSEALAGLLLELGMDPRTIPDTLTGRRDLWRHRLAAKKALVVLDDAMNRGQIEPLLPSGAGCLTLVTSRHQLRVLPGTKPVALKVLDPDAGADLFLSVAGRTPAGDAERAVAERIAGLCGQLPLAIVLVAGRLAHRPHWSTIDITDLADEFETATDRLSELDAGDCVVRAAFDLSYRDLPPTRQLLFRRLGLHPGPDLEAYAVAALSGVELGWARRDLDALYSEHLLDEPARGRYRLHDLLRDYARILTDDDATIDNTRAVDRLLDYYQQTATHADRWLARRTRPKSDQKTPPAVGADGGVVAREFCDQQRASEWMRAERANLLACLEHTADRAPAQMIALTAMIARLLDRDGPWPLAARLHHRAARAAQHLGDCLAQASALSDLSIVHRLSDDYGQATDALQQALDLYHDRGDRLGEAGALSDLGIMRWLTDDYEQAGDLYGRALDLYRDLGDRLGEAGVLNNLGDMRRLARDYENASDLYRQALHLYCVLGSSLGEANAQSCLGFVCMETEDYVQAADLLQQALELYRDLGSALGEASALTALGCVRRETRAYEQAVDLLQQALALNRDIGNSHGEADTLGNLGILHESTDDYGSAIDLHQQALALYRDIGGRFGQAEELNGIGRALLATGESAEALSAFTEALGLACEIGNQFQRARALDGIARCRVDLGDTPAAVTDLKAALQLYRRLGVPDADPAAAYLAQLESRRATE